MTMIIGVLLTIVVAAIVAVGLTLLGVPSDAINPVMGVIGAIGGVLTASYED